MPVWNVVILISSVSFGRVLPVPFLSGELGRVRFDFSRVISTGMMDFEQRLQKAIDRGQRTRASMKQSEQARAATEEELRALHSSARLELTEHIEECLRKLADHFPGFDYETVIDEDGWGSRIRRDDLELNRGTTDRHYSHFEMLVRPYSTKSLLDMTAKGTIRNKEVIARSHFQRLQELDVDSFENLIDLWVLEFAEAYSAQN